MLGGLSRQEAKDSYGIVHDIVGDDWAPLFSAFADRECDEGVSTRQDWTKRIAETLRALRACSANTLAA